ncbi:TerS protein [Pseudoxanthomonas taiwanensis]|uniref:TerS protein n=1 Tax=Pseudoxanthomonas taiwanensis TaxID=176598 RepID=A0A921NRI9_9GAMM|nr:TerS protein [Pseudoxanthomonas taiwanensis]KAF1684882.1 TerS protein [Pseudoxanthomonas taiwanensis]
MRQTRSDSAAAAVQAAQNAAQGPLEPPAHIPLPDAARPFWAALVRNRPRHKWNEADLGNAAILAITQMQVHDLIGDVEQAALVDKLTRRIVSLSRLLHVHPEATEGRAQDQGNKLALEREAEADHDPLIPTLRVAK